jgi:hypothetical protein
MDGIMMYINRINVKIPLCLLQLILILAGNGWSGDPVGLWNFDDPHYLTKADLGNDLDLIGFHQPAIGIDSSDTAARIGIGSYYMCTHEIAANGGGNNVNEWSLIMDIRYLESSAGRWKCLYQTNQLNANDGDCFVSYNTAVGVGATGYSNRQDGTPYFGAQPEVWYRLVIVVDNGTLYDLYANGTKVLDGDVQDIDGRFSLDDLVLFFADDNSEDHQIDVSMIAIYDYPLSGTEVEALNGPGGEDPPPESSVLTFPYLQYVKSDGISIMWECSLEQNCYVEFGPDTTYGSIQYCVSEPTGGGTLVYKSVLENLAPDSLYHYRAVIGDYTGEDKTFRTAPAPSTSISFSFAIWSDSQGTNGGSFPDDPFEPTKSMLAHMADSGIDFAVSCGDLAENGDNYWDVRVYYLDRVAKYLGQTTPWFNAWGNHDLGKDSVIRNFSDLPSQERGDPFDAGYGTFSFDYGQCHFLCIDAANWNDYEWIESDLERAAAHARFIFVFCHYPPYCELWIDGTPDYRTHLVPLLERYGVDACLSGHTHDYERGILNGVYYCITGGGSWLDIGEPLIYDWQHMTVGGYHDLGEGIEGGLVNAYVRVDVEEMSFTAKMTAFNPDGSIMEGVSDSFGKLIPFESFEKNDGGYEGLMMWEWGTLSDYGPGGAHWGENCWATDLDGPYANNADSPLTSETFDLSEATSAWLNFYHYYDSESGHDGGNVKISTDSGASWTLITPEDGYPVSSMYWNGEPGYSGTSEGWELANFDLSSYLGEQVTFQFRFGSDGIINGPGWYIDDVYLKIACPVSISIIPDSDTVSGGTPLGFTVDAMNTADYPITIMVWSDVLLPNGSPYQRNPVFGPYTVTLDEQSNPSVQLSQMIPEITPSGTYTYIMRIGSYPNTIYTNGLFDFTVIP